MNRRFVIGWTALSAIGSGILGLTMIRGGEFVTWLAASAAGAAATGPLLAATLRFRAQHAGRFARLAVSHASAWLVMIVVVVTVFCVTRDPFAAERIAKSGLFVYFLTDRLLRGLIMGVFAGTFMFVWAWIPMGLLWHAVAGRIE